MINLESILKAVVAHFEVLCRQLPGGIWEDQETREGRGSYGTDANRPSVRMRVRNTEVVNQVSQCTCCSLQRLKAVVDALQGVLCGCHSTMNPLVLLMNTSSLYFRLKQHTSLSRSLNKWSASRA